MAHRRKNSNPNGCHFLLSGWQAVHRRRLWQCRCCQMLCDHGKAQNTPVQPHHLAPLTNRKLWVKVCMACVHSAMIHGSETWEPDAPDFKRFRYNDRCMIHVICGTKHPNWAVSASLLQKFGIEGIAAVLQSWWSSGCGQVRARVRIFLGRTVQIIH